MKTIYFDCSMGAAGDMLAAALLELHQNPANFITHMNKLGIPNVSIRAEKAVKCGITGTHFSVSVHGLEEKSEDIDTDSHDHTHHIEHTHEHTHEGGHNHSHEHNHNGLHEIEHLIEALPVSQAVKKNATAVYNLIAQAESAAHGVPLREVHFHEVGSMDAIADIIAVCLLLEELAPEQILASAIHAGSGQVRCAHGILPVPAPATAHILRGIPFYSGNVRGELCTPTGAALLKHFVTSFGSLPVFVAEKTGYGMGTKDFESANCLRAFWGETSTSLTDEITELVCTLDDITGESLAFAQQQLLENGALDAYVKQVMMKKGRCGFELTCLCKNSNVRKFTELMFKHTTTTGIREKNCRRYVLDRQEKTVQTIYGKVRVKTSSGYGCVKSKTEYEDLAAIARANGITLAEVAQSVNKES